jgi:hypothetical protein
LFKPKEMFGLHKDGTEAGDFFRTIYMRGPDGGWKEAEREGGEGEMEVEFCGLGEDGLGEAGGFLGCG